MEAVETRSHLILSFILDSEPGDYDEDEDNAGSLSAMLPIRSALAKGDRRALYLGWLSAVQNGLVDSDVAEPPVPPGLGADDDALESLIGFLNLPEDLVAAASRNSSPPPPTPTRGEIVKWLAEIDADEKDQWLSRLVLENDPAITLEILNRYRDSTRPAENASHPLRSAEDLLSEADDLETARLDRQRQEAAQKERARILALAGQESGLWKSVIKLSESSSSNYQDSAIRTLGDLRTLAEMTDATSDFREKLESLIELRRRKSSFMNRLREWVWLRRFRSVPSPLLHAVLCGERIAFPHHHEVPRIRFLD